MIFCADAGNTNIVFACYRDDQLIFTSRLKTDATLTKDQYAIDIHTLLEVYDIRPEQFEGAIVCSVVPPLTQTLCQAIEMALGCPCKSLSPGIKTGLNILIDNPAEAGADLVAASVGAKGNYPLPIIILDMGTASKIIALDKEGNFVGCSILPGLQTSMTALVGSASLLTDFEMNTPKHAIGRNTTDSLRSGSILGFASMMDGMIDRFQEELGGKATVVATGGLISRIAPALHTPVQVRDDLVTEGLRLIYERNLEAHH